ncbi:MAG TPA: HAMP domain-containing sensor histidine kinase [Prosthecobacter sp.]|nr:HAMP domain-containing sensor histidine kinase [Prosthecobacter sp.]
MIFSTPRWRLFWTLLPLLAVAACAVLAVRAEREALIRELRPHAQELCQRAAESFVRELARADSIPLPKIDERGHLIEEGFLYPEAPSPQPPSEAQEWFAKGEYERVLKDAPNALSRSGLPLAPLCVWKQMQAEEDPARLKVLWAALVEQTVHRHPSALSHRLLIQGWRRLDQHGVTDEEAAVKEAWGQWEEDWKLRNSLRQNAAKMQSPHTGWLGLRDGLKVEGLTGYVFHANDLRDDRPAELTGWRVIDYPPLARIAHGQIREAEAELPPFAKMRLTLHPLNFANSSGSREQPEQLITLSDRQIVRATVYYSETPDFHLAVLRHLRWTGGALSLAFLACAFGAWQTHRASRRQEQLAQQKSNFISSVSHELRAPLASLRLMSESLVDGTVTDAARTREYHQVMHEESVRLAALVDNVLDLARIERGVKTYTFAPYEPAELIADAVRLMTPRAERQGTKWQIEIGEFRTPPQADAAALRQALVNLLDNALKHSPEGRVITVHARPQDELCWTLSVADQGPGIPAGERGKVFDLFYRIGSELRRETTGTGLGLGLVEHIAEGHGGAVSIDDAAGGGALVTLKLKLHPQPTE